MNGVDNDVVPAYTSITAWEKAGVNYFLAKDLTPDEFHAVSRIMDALLDEGPADGISLIGDKKRFINLYLDQAEKQPLDANDIETIRSLRDWATEDEENLTAVCKRCDEILGDK